MANDIMEYTKSSSAMKAKWIDMLRARFDEERNDGAIPSDLNAGIIGYSFDIMANAIEDAAFEANTRSKEIFVTSAKFNDSVYQHAMSCKINDFFATPAYVDVLIGVRTRAIYNNAIDYISSTAEGYKKLTLSKNTKFRIGELYYTIDYPIDIIVKNNNIITSKYNIDENDMNEFSDISSTYMIGKIQTIQGLEYYVFKTKARQLISTVTEYQYTPTTMESEIYSVSYEAQLAGFDVYYQETVDSDWEKLTKVYSGNLSLDVSKKFCYYRLFNDNTFEVYFSSAPDTFSPAYNSKFRIVTYITEGAAGNVKISSIIDETTGNESGLNLDIVLDQDSSDPYQDALIGVVPVGEVISSESKYGKDMPTIEDIRIKTIDVKSSRNTIISDQDLLRILSEYGVNVIKHRDDFFARKFLTYALIQDNDINFIMQSRTGNLYIEENSSRVANDVDDTNKTMKPLFSQVSTKSYMVNPFSIFKIYKDKRAISSTNINAFEYDSIASYANYKDTERDLIISQRKKSKENGTGELMVCPYLIKIFRDPYFVALYDVHCNDGVTTNLLYNHLGCPEKFSITNIRVIRENITDYNYTIRCTLNCSAEIAKAAYENAINSPNACPVSVKVEFLDDDDVTYAYAEMTDYYVLNENAESIEFSLTMPTVNKISSDGYIYINNVLVPTNDDLYKSGIPIQEYPLPNESKLRFYVVYSPPLYALSSNTSENENGDIEITDNFKLKNEDQYENSLILSPVEKNQNILYRANEDTDAYVITDVYETPNKVLFLNNVSDVFGPSLGISRTAGELNKYQERVYATYKDPIYEYDNNGNMKYVVANYEEDGYTPIRPENLEEAKAIIIDGKLKGYHKVSGNGESVPVVEPWIKRIEYYGEYYKDIYQWDNETEKYVLIKKKLNELDESSEVINAYIIPDSDPYSKHWLSSYSVDDDGNGGDSFTHVGEEPNKYYIITTRPIISEIKMLDVNKTKYMLDDYTGEWKAVILHEVGDDKYSFDNEGNTIYKVDPVYTYIIKNVPLVPFFALKDDDFRSMIYNKLDSLAKQIQDEALPKLIENNEIVVSLYNTVGPSNKYIVGRGNTTDFKMLDSLDLSIEINVSTNDLENVESLKDNLSYDIQWYINNEITKNGYLYAFDMLNWIKEKYSSEINYIEFVSINNFDSSDYQTIKTNPNLDDNIKLVPERITVAQILDEEEYKRTGIVNLSPDITINIIDE